MRRRNRELKTLIFITLLFIIIGFGSVTASIIVNGTMFFGVNNTDFVIIFTKSVVDGVDMTDSTISDDGKTITFSTKDLVSVGDYSKLEFRISNTSKQFDADVIINCVSEGNYHEYYSIKSSLPSYVYASSSETGMVQITLNKNSIDELTDNFKCTIDAHAIERIKLGSELDEINNEISMFSWRDVPFLDYNIEETITVMNDLKVTNVYHSFDESSLATSFPADVSRSLNESNIELYYLTGDSTWFNNPSIIKEKIDLLADYNSRVSEEEKIAGIAIDLEPYLNDTFNADPINNFLIYANTLETAYNYANSNNLKLINIVPYWYDTKYLDENTYTAEEITLIEDALNKIYNNSDRISIMNYYKTNMVKGIKYEMELAEKIGVEVESIAEYSRPQGTAIPETISLWIEDDSIRYAKSKWLDILDEYQYINTRFAYHDLEALLEVKGLYKRNTFDLFDAEGNALPDTNLVIKFPDGTYEIINSSKEPSLPKDHNYEILINGYEVTENIITDIGDNSINNALYLNPLESYTLEIYPKVFSGTDYLGISTGTIILKNEIYGIEKDANIKKDKYATVSNIYANTPYEIIVTDEQGNNYTFEYATSKDQASILHTISKNENIIIPQGFKTTLYAVLTLYLK